MDGSGVRSTFSFSEDWVFFFQDPVTLTPEDPTPFSGFHIIHTYVAYTHIYTYTFFKKCFVSGYGGACP